MKLATLSNGTADGALVVVSRDLSRAVTAGTIAPSLRAAIDDWTATSGPLLALSDELNAGRATGDFAFAPEIARAPLPRAWQWLDGSVFQIHQDLAARAFGLPNPFYERPLMYQGMSHEFLSGLDDVPFPNEEDGIDFEGEFGIITDFVPAGTTAAEAQSHIILLTQLNDWSLRVPGRDEMTRGYGWIWAKPACSMAPVVITPDELGDAWSNARIHLDLAIDVNGTQFGRANGREMRFGFNELVAHAAYSRNLCAGTIIGSGTVANADYKIVGSSCIAERRGIEILEHTAAQTPFLTFGDRVQMAARDARGEAPFGVMNQRVVPMPRAAKLPPHVTPL
jgi:fumarylacetoacetate (FAA) hydrolase